MKFRKKHIIILLIFILLVFILCLYPKKTNLSAVISNHCTETNITKIKLSSTTSNLEKSLTNKDDINDFLSNLLNIQVTKTFTNISKQNPGFDYIEIYENNSLLLGIFVFDNNFITILNMDGASENFRIIDTTLDINNLNTEKTSN